MSFDISGFGLQINITASNTFPAGFVVTQFADDSDPIEASDLEIMDKAMGLNGDLIYWKAPKPIEVKISVVPGSDDDANLEILFEANTARKGAQASTDEIDMTLCYPDGRIITLTGGAITGGAPFPGVASAGRQKTRTYGFVFEATSRS
jgi:hypothetical protein